MQRRRKSSSSPITAVDKPKPGSIKAGAVTQWLHKTVPLCLAFAYGFVTYLFFAFKGVLDGFVLHRPDASFWAAIEVEQNRQWLLQKPHPSGLHHRFLTLASGLRLHYLTNGALLVPNDRNSAVRKTKNLIIFLHGWPDSAGLWTNVFELLPNTLVDTSTLVAVDLPGFGGSDSLNHYGPDHVLPALLEFTTTMRDTWLDEKFPEDNKVVMVAFDWGGVIGFRLASEAPQICDRFIICNAPLPQLATKNIIQRIQTTGKLLAAWRRNFHNYYLFKNAVKPLGPIFAQLRSSAYVFTFNLPWLLARETVLRCNLWLLRYVHSTALGNKTISDAPEVISGLASYLGPVQPLQDDERVESYSASVKQRYRSGYSLAEPLRYYREGLASQPWQKSLEMMVQLSDLDKHNTSTRKKTASSGTSSRSSGALGAPATIIWGDCDIALDHRIMIEGIEEYLKRDSQVIRLPKVGHWLPKEGEGPAVMAAVIDWVFDEEDGEKRRLVDVLSRVSTTARVSLEK